MLPFTRGKTTIWVGRHPTLVYGLPGRGWKGIVRVKEADHGWPQQGDVADMGAHGLVLGRHVFYGDPAVLARLRRAAGR
jgi:hypothetical protein